jgi:hypothetical protein
LERFQTPFSRLITTFLHRRAILQLLILEGDMASAFSKLRWVDTAIRTRTSPKFLTDISSNLSGSRPFSTTLPADVAAFGGNDRRVALSTFLQSAAFPRWDGATSAKEEAIGLLQAASEVEHALLVQYLYAGYCLDASEIVLTDMFSSIARQEMAHLLLVNHLLILLGSKTHFDRDKLIPGSTFEPLPFALVPPSPTRLADFVVLEAPEVDVLATSDPQMAARLKIAADHISPAGAHHRVGALYAVIEWLFLAPPPPGTAPANSDLPPWHLDDADFFAGAGKFQNAVVWVEGRPDLLVDQVVDRTSALKAIRDISQQGESFEPAADSHFERFLLAFEASLNRGPLLRPVASHPNTLAAPSTIPEIEAGRISDPRTLQWARLANKRYQMLLALIPVALAISRDDADLSALGQQCISWSVQEMVTGIRKITEVLRSLPIAAGSATMAAPPFELEGLTLPADAKGLAGVVERLQDECAELIAKIMAETNPPVVQRVFLRDLLRKDQERRGEMNKFFVA